MLRGATILICASVALAKPANIGCDLKVIAGKTNAGENIMTTTASIMGRGSPQFVPFLNIGMIDGSIDGGSYIRGVSKTITLNLANTNGFIHASAGTITFVDNYSSLCNSARADWQGTSGPSSFTWTPPSDVTNLDEVIFSMAYATSTNAVSRSSFVLTKALNCGDICALSDGCDYEVCEDEASQICTEKFASDLTACSLPLTPNATTPDQGVCCAGSCKAGATCEVDAASASVPTALTLGSLFATILFN